MPEPRKAATVIPVRENDGVQEILLLKRGPGSPFLPLYYVFPGGALDDEDFDDMYHQYCLGDEEMASSLMDDIKGEKAVLPFWVAAVRETFEETGILCAVDRDGQYLSEKEMNKRGMDEYRARLLKEEILFADILREENLMIPVKDIQYITRWITPPFSPIRYDARFFVIKAPEGQRASCDGIECIDDLWVTPEEALEKNNSSSLSLAIPTYYTIEDLMGRMRKGTVSL